MNKMLSVLGSLLALLCALSVPAMHRAMAWPAPDHHPNYREAIHDLHEARKKLETAEADGYGHRDRAMHAIDRAIAECDQAIATLH